MSSAIYNWATGWFNCWLPNETKKQLDEKSLSRAFFLSQKWQRVTCDIIKAFSPTHSESLLHSCFGVLSLIRRTHRLPGFYFELAVNQHNFGQQ